jgi:hypothetical protein
MNFQSNIGNNPKWELKFSSIYYVHDSTLVKNLDYYYYPILFVTHICNGHLNFTLLVSNNILFGDIMWEIFPPHVIISNIVICIY